VQTCIVHQIRGSMRYVAYKDRKAVARDLKPIYRAVNADAAETALAAFEETWGEGYPMIAENWRQRWDYIVPFLALPADLRRALYTTNRIENLNRQIRKSRHQAHLPRDPQSRRSMKKPYNWTSALKGLKIHFGDRLPDRPNNPAAPGPTQKLGHPRVTAAASTVASSCTVRALKPRDTMRVDGLRTTTPARTIVDLAGTLKGRELRHLVERAQDLQRFHPEEIRPTANGRPGTRALINLLDLMQPDKDNARSHLERLFLAVVRRARLPRPRVNHPIAGKRRDFVWPEDRLVVEVDGYEYHSSREAMRKDRRRDRELTAQQWRPARFTFEEVAFEPLAVAQELAILLQPDARGGTRTHTSREGDSRV
jgi:very-short-patch-repair endonuclease